MTAYDRQRTDGTPVKNVSREDRCRLNAAAGEVPQPLRKLRSQLWNGRGGEWKRMESGKEDEEEVRVEG